MPGKDDLDPLVRMKKMNAMFGGKAKLAEVRKKLGQDYELIGPKRTIKEPISDEEAKKKMEEEIGVIREEERKEPWQEIEEIKKELKRQLAEREEKKEELEEERKPLELEDKGIEFDLRKELENKKIPAEKEKEAERKFAFKKEFAPKEKEKPLTAQEQIIKPFEMEAKQKKPEPWTELGKEKKPLIEEEPKAEFQLEKFEAKEEPKKEEKEKKPFAKPSPEWLKEIDKKFSETQQPKELVFNSILTEKAASPAPQKKEKIETEGIRIEPIKTRKQTEEENMLKGFVLGGGEEQQIQLDAKLSKEELLEKLKEGIETKKPEEKKPVDNIIKLTKIIPKNVDKEFIEKEEKEDDSLGKQLGSITSFFSSNITKSMGGKPINQGDVAGLSNEEKKEVKKLVSILGPATKKYTKEEIYESIILENHPKKVAEKVISILYQE